MKQQKQPFFSRFLEDQDHQKVNGVQLQGGAPIRTQKWPSDADEPTTQKWPSDDDEY